MPMLRMMPALDGTFPIRRVGPAPAVQLDLFAGLDGREPPAAEMPREEVRAELIGMINPLATVVGFTDLLLDEELDEEQARLALAANDAGREIERKVRTLLARLDEARRATAAQALEDELDAELDRLAAAAPGPRAV